MKTVLRIFNLFFMAFALAAITCLLVMPTIEIKLHYNMTSEQVANLLPKQEGSESTVDYKELLGDEGLNIDLGVKLPAKALLKSITEDANTVINEEIIDPNVYSLTDSMRTTLFSMGTSVLKYAVSTALPKLFDNLIEQAQPEEDTRTPAEIRAEVGMDNQYFATLSTRIIDTIRDQNPTVTSVNNVVCDSMNEAIEKLNQQNEYFQIPPMSEDDKQNAREMTVGMLNTMDMVKSDNESLYPFATVVDSLVVATFRSSNNETAPENETIEQRAEQLKPTVSSYIKNMMPSESYDTIALFLKIVLGVIALFTLVWAVYFLNTFFRTIFARQKVWTFSGPIFWLMGIIQIALGVGITVAGSVLLNGTTLANMIGNTGDAAKAAEMISGLNVSITTCTLIPSIILLVMIPTTITYFVFKQKYKKQLKLNAAK